jgi:nitrilase
VVVGVVAAVQSSPVYLDSMATAHKAAGLIGECADRGAWLAVFPESFLPGNPEFIDRTVPGSEPFLAFEEAFLGAAVQVPGPETDVIAAACEKHEMTVAMGVTERPERSGTLYNSLLYFGSDGSILGRHRKLMPTFNERMVWGMGDGTTLRTVDTAHGRVGGLICWENYMPLARMALYSQNELIHVAPTLNPGTEGWIASMRAIANEGRMWVISVGNLMTGDDIPEFLMEWDLYERGEMVNPGGSAIIDPQTDVVAGPVYGEEAILTTEVDPAFALATKRMFDVVGHYGRADIFNLEVNGQEVPLQSEDRPSQLNDVATEVWRVASPESPPPRT